jgi:hypothetical protein
LFSTLGFHRGIWVKAMTYELAWRSAAILHHIDRKYAFDKLICHHGGKNSFCINDSKFEFETAILDIVFEDSSNFEFSI